MAQHIRMAAISGLLALATSVAAEPRLSLTQEVIDGKGGITWLGGARAIVLSSSDGAFLHVAVSGDDHALDTFSISMTTGQLTLVEAEVEGVDSVSGLTGAQVVGVSPDGAHVYVGGVAIVIFSRNPVTGATHYDATQGYAERMSGLAFSPGGEHAYIVTDVPSPEAELEVYERDGVTGALTLIQQVSDDQGGVDGLERASSVAVSPDGKHVYVGGRFDNAVAAFERDLVTGELTFLQHYVDGAGGIDGLRRPEFIVVSPDGAQVYVGGGDDGLVQFDRDAGTGLLTFVEHAALDTRIGALAITADGTRLAAADLKGEPDRVALLTRDTGTGGVTEVAEEAFDGVRVVAISPDGSYVYAANSQSVGVFRVVTTACSATPMAGCLLPTLPQKALLQLRDSADDAGDKLTAKWVKGAAFSIGAFGDPIAQADDVVTCIYDTSANPQPVLDALVPAAGSCRGKPCWKVNGSGNTLKYKDPDLLPDGIRGFTAKGTTAGASWIKVKGKRAGLPLPSLPLTPPVRFQVQAATGTCWEAAFSTPITNDATQFKAKGD